MGSNVTEWLAALDRIAKLDVDWVVPGHGEVVTIEYLARQRSNLLDWVAAVTDAVAQGWSREETVAADQLRRPLPGGHRAGLHDEPHPDPQRRVAMGQDHPGAAGLSATNRD